MRAVPGPSGRTDSGRTDPPHKHPPHTTGYGIAHIPLLSSPHLTPRHTCTHARRQWALHTRPGHVASPTQHGMAALNVAAVSVNQAALPQ